MSKTERPRFEYSQFSQDEHGNIWLNFSPEMRTRSILYEDRVAEHAVITKAGMEASKAIDRQRLFQQLLAHPIVNGPRSALQGIASAEERESQINLVHSKDYQFRLPWYKQLLTRWSTAPTDSVVAVEKVYTERSLSGSEMIQIFDIVRPVIEKYGFQLVKPYGGAGTRLFLPFVEGETLSSAMRDITAVGNAATQEFNLLFVKGIVPTMQAEINRVLEEYLLSVGFSLDGFKRFVFRKNTIGVFAKGDIDIKDQLSAFDNYLLPEETKGRVIELLHAEQTTEALKVLISSLVIIDPVYVTEHNHM